MDRRGRREARAMEQMGKKKAGMGLEGQVQRMRGRRASVWARAVGQGSGGGGSWGWRGGTGGFPSCRGEGGAWWVWPGEWVASRAASEIQKLGPAQ